MTYDDTICAPATAVGTGAISIIRISGPRAIGITDAIVRFRRGTAAESRGYTLKFGEIGGVDEGMVAIFRAPHSYTGEDSVELYCHASAYIVRKVIERLIAEGCRMAGPGEFTRRAYVNGKMDLAQAEAVADVISASSEVSHRVAMNQLKGGYSNELRGLRDQLLELSMLLELELDFSEEEVEFAGRGKLDALLGETLGHIVRLADSFREGNAVKNGVPVAIIGSVNAGKSTLLNALVGEERAIVSDIPGTTRDTVEEVMNVDGIQFRFIDTAGLRETEDVIEKIGIERSIGAVGKADVVIGVIDGCSATVSEDIEALKKLVEGKAELIIVINKMDLVSEGASALVECASAVAGAGGASAVEGISKAGCASAVAGAGGASAVAEAAEAEGLDCAAGVASAAGLGVEGAIGISARTGAGIDQLRERLAASQRDRFGDGSGTLVTSMRHYEALCAARESLQAVRNGLATAIPTDLLAEDLRSAINSLGSIWGEGLITPQETLNAIFSKHCIGK